MDAENFRKSRLYKIDSSRFNFVYSAWDMIETSVTWPDVNKGNFLICFSPGNFAIRNHSDYLAMGWGMDLSVWLRKEHWSKFCFLNIRLVVWFLAFIDSPVYCLSGDLQPLFSSSRTPLEDLWNICGWGTSRIQQTSEEFNKYNLRRSWCLCYL